MHTSCTPIWRICWWKELKRFPRLRASQASTADTSLSQEGWCCPNPSSISDTEPLPYETAVQDNYIEADPLENMTRGLVLKDVYFHIQTAFTTGDSWDLLTRKWPINTQSFPWTVTGSPHFYNVHGCGSFPAETDGNPHSELPRRLAYSGPVGRRATISQILPPQPLWGPGIQGQFCQELCPSQRISFLSIVFDSAQMRAVVMPERVLAIQQLVASFKIGARRPLVGLMLSLIAPASLVLQVGLLSIQPLHYWLKPRVPPMLGVTDVSMSVEQACVAAWPLERLSVDETGRALWYGLQKEGGLNRCF